MTKEELTKEDIDAIKDGQPFEFEDSAEIMDFYVQHIAVNEDVTEDGFPEGFIEWLDDNPQLVAKED